MAARRSNPVVRSTGYLTVSMVLTLFGLARLVLDIRRVPAKPPRRA